MVAELPPQSRMTYDTHENFILPFPDGGGSSLKISIIGSKNSQNYINDLYYMFLGLADFGLGNPASLPKRQEYANPYTWAEALQGWSPLVTIPSEHIIDFSNQAPTTSQLQTLQETQLIIILGDEAASYLTSIIPKHLMDIPIFILGSIKAHALDAMAITQTITQPNYEEHLRFFITMSGYKTIGVPSWQKLSHEEQDKLISVATEFGSTLETDPRTNSIDGLFYIPELTGSLEDFIAQYPRALQIGIFYVGEVSLPSNTVLAGLDEAYFKNRGRWNAHKFLNIISGKAVNQLPTVYPFPPQYGINLAKAKELDVAIPIESILSAVSISVFPGESLP